jgi:DNA-binding IclR family transcriptional regulator
MKPQSQHRNTRTGSPAIREVPAVTRALKILRFLAKSKHAMGVAPLARELKMIPSTCLHIVRVLLDNGMLNFNPQNKRYSLGPGVVSLATAYSHLNPLVQVVRFHFQALSRLHDCAFAAIEESGPDHYIVVAATEPSPGLSIRLALGSRFPILISATGLCFAAFNDMTPAQLKDGFAKLRSDNLPPFASWLKQVELVRVSGYAVDSGQYMRGLAVVAVPIFSNGTHMVGALCAVGLSEQIKGTTLAALIQSLRETVIVISSEMGHDDSVDRDMDENPSAAPIKLRRPRRK